MTINIDPRLDPYKILGVSADASQDEIKKAYRKLAKEHHPDSTGGDKVKESRFKEISQAYDILSDKDKRAQYDAMRSGGFPGAGFPGGFPGGGGEGQWDIGDLFAQMFQGGARGGPGGGVHFRFDQRGTPFESESPFGGPRRRRRAPEPAAEPVERKVRAADGSPLTQRGSDIYSDVRLALDQAILGTVAEVPTLSGTSRIKVPPGTSSGVKLRLKGKGAPTAGGGHGDHYVTVHIDVPKKVDEEAKKLLVQFMQQVKKTV